MAKDPFAAAERHIHRESRALRKDRLGDFRRARGMSDAIFSNILGDVGTARRRVSRGNARDLAAIQRLMAQQRATTRGVHAGMLGAGGHTAAADYAGQAFSEAGATVAGGGVAAAGQARAAGGLAEGSQAALDMIRGSVKSTAEAARYATAQALTTRAQQDVTTIGAQQHDLDMARIQYAQQQAMQMAMERQQEAFQAQQATLAYNRSQKQREQDHQWALQQSGQLPGGANQLIGTVQSVGTVFSALRDIGGDVIDSSDVPTLVNMVETSQGIDPTNTPPATLALITQFVRQYKQNHGYAGNTRAQNVDIVATLMQAYPGYKDAYHKKILEMVQHELELDLHAREVSAANAGAATPAGTGYSGYGVPSVGGRGSGLGT